MSYTIDTNKVYLVTGTTGFIGYYVSLKLLKAGCGFIV